MELNKGSTGIRKKKQRKPVWGIYHEIAFRQVISAYRKRDK